MQIGRATLLRILYFFIPQTIAGPMLLYCVLYWWFVPVSMRFSVPLSFPSVGVKILATLGVFPMLILSRHASEAVASSLPEMWTTSLHRVIAPVSFVLNLLSGLLVLCLFTPLIGIAALPPSTVAGIFGCFVLFAWLNTLKSCLGIFAHVDAAKRRTHPIIGPFAPELLATDKRPPILYLRSFAKERWKATTLGRFSYIRAKPGGFYFKARRPRASDDFFSLLRKSLYQEYKRKFFDSNRSVHDEQMLFAEYFSELGPYIAIGRPGEAFESMDLGAAKYYVPDEAWTTKVIELLDSSVVILIEAAESEGLSWEIRKVLSRVPPEKVLLILPRNDADYREFCLFAAGLFPHPMPEELPRTRLVMFAGDWLPIPLEDYTMFLEDAVQPFVARLGLTSPSETIPNEGMKPDQHHAR